MQIGFRAAAAVGGRRRGCSGHRHRARRGGGRAAAARRGRGRPPELAHEAHVHAAHRFAPGTVVQAHRLRHAPATQSARPSPLPRGPPQPDGDQAAWPPGLFGASGTLSSWPGRAAFPAGRRSPPRAPGSRPRTRRPACQTRCLRPSSTLRSSAAKSHFAGAEEGSLPAFQSRQACRVLFAHQMSRDLVCESGPGLGRGRRRPSRP
jgi:hypothetical protein